jgi:hypothetical protein
MRAPPWITDCPHQLLTEILGAVQPRFDLATRPLLTQPLLVWAPLASFEQVSRYAMNHASWQSCAVQWVVLIKPQSRQGGRGGFQ